MTRDRSKITVRDKRQVDYFKVVSTFLVLVVMTNCSLDEEADKDKSNQVENKKSENVFVPPADRPLTEEDCLEITKAEILTQCFEVLAKQLKSENEEKKQEIDRLDQEIQKGFGIDPNSDDE